MYDRKCLENKNKNGKYLDWPYEEHICTLQKLLTAETCTTTTKSRPAEIPLKFQAPPISLINAAAFKWACKMDSSITFQLNIALSNVKGHTTNLDPKLVNMEYVPEAYQDFTDVFSKAKADTLAPHQPYDLKIVLEDGTTPPQPLIYSLLNSKLGTLWEFIDKHLKLSFIQPSHSSHSAPILSVKKKDGLLWLCVWTSGV